MRVAILGATGFVGRNIAQEALSSGHDLSPIRSPRLTIAARAEADILDEIHTRYATEIEALALQLTEIDVVINAAGLAEPGSALTNELVGGNSALPALVAIAAGLAGTKRYVHISSAAVYGDVRVLDEATSPQPSTPYGLSKLWGENVAAMMCERPHAGSGPLAPIVYRATSVHGAERSITRQIQRLARSPFSSVAKPGDDPTPQTDASSVAKFVMDIAQKSPAPTGPLVHPWEGWTTYSFLEHMGGGRRPKQIPRTVTKALVTLTNRAGRLHPTIQANARRLDMLWHGQEIRHRPENRALGGAQRADRE